MEKMYIGILALIVVMIIALLVYMFMDTEEAPVVSKAADQPQVKVAAPLPAAPVSVLSNFTMTKGVDRGGADIGCYNDKPVEYCAEKCMADVNCKAVNSFGGSCCYKNSIAPLVPNSSVIFYQRK